MEHQYDGPIFDATCTTGNDGGVIVPDIYLNIPQGRINDMILEEPGMATDINSVARDRKSGHRFVYTFDNLSSHISAQEVKNKPFIYKVMLDMGKTAVESYILDYRRVQNLMYPSTNLGYDPKYTPENLDESYELRGTVPALAAIMRHAGEVHYIGEMSGVSHAEEFVQKVDELVEEMTSSKSSVKSPAYRDGFDAFHTPEDEKISRMMNRSEDKLR